MVSFSVSRALKPLLALAALALPVIAVQRYTAWHADHLASIIARQISAIAALARPTSADAEGDEESLDIAALVGADPSALSTPIVTSKKRGPLRAPPRATRGVRVSAAQVLALAARRAMPKAVPVKASAEHPAGLLLRGVSGLGIGMQDGDVLTEAAGQKATSVAVVVGVVLAARGRQATEISGRFYRAGVPYLLVVEQPYPTAPPSSVAPSVAPSNPG